ncbi:unnamed protein product [Orchesella dallaii]|uniref:Uncharacterized protein n=1 Tax=Orchesella dallaii TaxID=48710 RepID=A0ABP1PZR4_9HEXA
MLNRMSVVGLVLGVVLSCVSAYAAIHYHAHVQKRQSSYSKDNNYYVPRSQSSGYYNSNGFGQPGYYHQYEHPPQYSQAYGTADPIQGSFANANPIQRELNVRNGQLRQKEYQQRTGQEGRETYDPFYFYVNPVAAATALGAPLAASTSLGPALVPSTTSVSFRERVGGPSRNRRNSLIARDSHDDNEINEENYEILNKSSYPNGQLNYPYPTTRYSSGAHQPASGIRDSNQFLNYEQIVGAQPPRYASGSPSRGQPWSIQIGTQLKVNDDSKGPTSGSRFYVRDERNTRPRQPLYRK